MEVDNVLRILLIAIASLVMGVIAVKLAWRAIGIIRVRRAGPSRLRARRRVIWRDPGAVEDFDFVHGAGGRDSVPHPPFRFLEEHPAGSSPCLSVVDARQRVWRVKWGDEVRSETFAARMVAAAGYFTEITHFVATGRLDGAHDLITTSACVNEDSTFVDARFELDERGVRKHFDEHGWAWNDNPFVGSRQLQGLKIMMMLLSNWDNKDVRDVARGSNTAIFEYSHPSGETEARYLIIDWGGSMGSWGSVLARGKWDCAGFEAQTPQLVIAIRDGFVQWGYVGQRTADAAEGITVEDVRWLYGYLGRVTDDQIRAGLRASGADAEETERFANALRERLRQLERIANP
jgi:hypothetical protein